MPISERGVDDVCEALEHNASHKNGCALLLGAGCSISAGIPGAEGIVDIIKTNHRQSYDRAKTKTYPACMAELTTGQRRGLIGKIITDCKKLNWAHFGIAQLLKAGFVDRILTVNFDPLIIKACATVGEFPAIYDFAVPLEYESGRVAEKAVFYLHGQHSGFAVLNTDQEVQRQAERVRPVIRDTSQRRTWVIVGYSGFNDPVFNELAALPNYDYALYWVQFGKEDPAPQVQRLLDRENAFLIRNYSADEFFVELCQKLKCFPPKFVGAPFTHLQDTLAAIADFPRSDVDLLQNAKTLVFQAIEKFEERVADGGAAGGTIKDPRLLASELFAENDIVSLQSLYEEHGKSDGKISALLAWAYTREGIALYEQAAKKDGAETDRLFALAGEKYEKALAIKPDMHEALFNWGIALYEQAAKKDGAEADRLLALAGEKYEKALAIKPDKHGALSNWGNALCEQAKKKDGAEADRLFALAGEKFEEALANKPDMHEALTNWGNALYEQAAKKDGPEADHLFALAGEKYEKALAIKPDEHGALNNWGNALSDQATKKDGAEADRLFTLAGEKFEKTLAIKPDMHEALNNWGNALCEQAKKKDGAEADRLFALAGEKYEKALAIKPDKHEARNNWGIALGEQAKKKDGAEADRLFALAGEKYEKTLAIKPDMHEALNNWGIALSDQGKKKDGAEAKRLFALAAERTRQAYRLSPSDAAYNLACICALQNELADAVKYLIESRDAGKLPNRDHVLADEDFASIRDTREFQQFVTETFG